MRVRRAPLLCGAPGACPRPRHGVVAALSPPPADGETDSHTRTRTRRRASRVLSAVVAPARMHGHAEACMRVRVPALVCLSVWPAVGTRADRMCARRRCVALDSGCGRPPLAVCPAVCCAAARATYGCAVRPSSTGLACGAVLSWSVPVLPPFHGALGRSPSCLPPPPPPPAGPVCCTSVDLIFVLPPRLFRKASLACAAPRTSAPRCSHAHGASPCVGVHLRTCIYVCVCI